VNVSVSSIGAVDFGPCYEWKPGSAAGGLPDMAWTGACGLNESVARASSAGTSFGAANSTYPAGSRHQVYALIVPDSLRLVALTKAALKLEEQRTPAAVIAQFEKLLQLPAGSIRWTMIPIRFIGAR